MTTFLAFAAVVVLMNIVLYLCARPSIRRRGMRRAVKCRVIIRPVVLSPLDVEELRAKIGGDAA